MKKFFLSALVAMMLTPMTLMAEGWTQYVTNKSELDNALSAFTGKNGETCTIVVVKAKNADGTYEVADNSVVINANYGAATAQMANMLDGTLVITSNAASINDQPRLQLGMEFPTQASDSHLSLVFRNISLEYRSQNLGTSGQVLYWKGTDCHADSLVFDNCNIANMARTLIRTYPAQDADGNFHSDCTLHTFKMTNCLVHDNNILKGNHWPLVYLGVTTDEIIIRNNMFYNMPFSKNILTYAYCDPTGAGTRVDFENNTVVIAKGTGTDVNGDEGTSNFDIINVGTYLGTMAQYNINNNLLLTPQAGEYPVWKQLTTKGMVNFPAYGQSRALVCNGGIVNVANNVMEGYAPWSAGNNLDKETLEPTWVVAPADEDGRMDMATAGLSWSDFYDASTSDFRLLKSHPLYTMGKVVDEAGYPTSEPTYIGSSLMYVDAFPQQASIKVNISGSNYVDYTIYPVKENYETGDQVTITLVDHNSYYRTINTFKGWSDGNMDNPRTITLDGDVELTANYEVSTEIGKLITLMDFKKVTGNFKGTPASYAADVYMDDEHQAVLTYLVTDTVGLGAGTVAAPFNMVEATQIQARAAKFGEDPVEKQIPVLSRRTPSVARTADQQHYFIVAFSTKGVKGVSFSCLVGSDNMALKTQKLEYSLDKQNWTEFAKVDLEGRPQTYSSGEGVVYGWTELSGVLPESLEEKDVVYVRIIGDTTSELAKINDTLADTGDTFEYTGSILITASGLTNGIADIRYHEFDNDVIYNLQGMKVKATAKGLLIKNGKKYVAK